MKPYFSMRYNELDTQQKDIVQAGVELFRHYRYENSTNESEKSKLRQYSGSMSLQDKQDLFSKSLTTVAKKYANLPSEHQFNETALQSHPTVKWTMFSLISEMLDIIVPETVMDNFSQFADVKSVGWGDNLVFNVPNSDLFVVSTASNGKRKGTRQRLLGSDVILTPVNHIITVGEDWYRIVSGKVNWGEFVTRVVRSVETQITVDVYNAIIDSYPTLGAGYKETGAFAQDKFNRLTQRTVAANGGGTAAAFGSKLALSKVVPADQYFKFGLGDKYNAHGYLTNFQGTDLFELEQRLIPNTDDFAIDEETLLILSSAVQKIVKIGFEGNTQIIESQATQNADLSVDYTIHQRWDVKIVTSGRYAMWNSLA
ncbi:hypothetical protein [Paenibacillus sp. USHLN196]|uniref:hypothetical protein n=1 Tax=Paenibacillus sp. USHLN196 TaxID=3081291 RepID=UPI003016C116